MNRDLVFSLLLLVPLASGCGKPSDEVRVPIPPTASVPAVPRPASQASVPAFSPVTKTAVEQRAKPAGRPLDVPAAVALGGLPATAADAIVTPPKAVPVKPADEAPTEATASAAQDQPQAPPPAVEQVVDDHFDLIEVMCSRYGSNPEEDRDEK